MLNKFKKIFSNKQAQKVPVEENTKSESANYDRVGTADKEVPENLQNSELPLDEEKKEEHPEDQK